MTTADRSDGPVTPSGLNHLVLNVRDIEESHRFWTEILGFKQVGALQPRADGAPRPVMRFYSGDHDGKLAHHDIALVENKALPAPAAEWAMFGAPQPINHIAIALPDRAAWLRQLEFLQRSGVTFHRRTDHGMTHSVYISDPNGYGVELLYELPREMWEGDIDAALNFSRAVATEGPAALADDIAGSPSFPARPAAAE